MQVILEFIKKNFIFLLFIGLGLVLCLVGVFEYLGSIKKKEAITFTSAEASQPSIAPKLKVSIDVAGRVINPGVYTLDEGKRLYDALIAAGGMAQTADRSYVSKRINLAQKVVDGAKIYIPAVGEMDQEEEVLGVNNLVELEEDIPEEESSLININNASMESLDTLPKIGPVTGQKIISNRPYGTVEELVSKKVLTQKTFDGLKDRIIAQ